MRHQKPVRQILMALMALLFFFPGNFFLRAAHADVSIICHPAVAGDTLTRAEIKKIFLGKKLVWDDEQEIRFVIMKKSDAHKVFVKAYTQKTPSQFTHYWKKLVFTGKGSAPKSFHTEAELIQYVSETAGAIGYVPSELRPENVKILKISDK